MENFFVRCPFGELIHFVVEFVHARLPLCEGFFGLFTREFPVDLTQGGPVTHDEVDFAIAIEIGKSGGREEG